MSILYPGFLWLLIPLALLFWTREKKMVETGHLIILMLLVLGLSRPAIKQGIEESPIEAKEFIITLDVSYSMKAKDIKPDRYTFAKETAHALLASNPTDNIMLIAFTSNPLLLSPPHYRPPAYLHRTGESQSGVHTHQRYFTGETF